MLFKIPAVLAAVAFFAGLSAATPIGDVEHSPALVNRDAGVIEDASTLMKRAPGPSGQLLAPKGEDWVFTEVGWPGAGFRFTYKPAYVKNPDPNCVNQRHACWATTKWLGVTLVSLTVPGREYKLANYLHTSIDNPAANIDTWLGVPVEAVCGDYRVRVIEHQRYFNQWVTFQSAAPLIHMQCLRYAGPSGP